MRELVKEAQVFSPSLNKRNVSKGETRIIDKVLKQSFKMRKGKSIEILKYLVPREYINFGLISSSRIRYIYKGAYRAFSPGGYPLPPPLREWNVGFYSCHERHLPYYYPLDPPLYLYASALHWNRSVGVMDFVSCRMLCRACSCLTGDFEGYKIEEEKEHKQKPRYEVFSLSRKKLKLPFLNSLWHFRGIEVAFTS